MRIIKNGFKENGFTVLELLVVIAILGIIAFSAGPQLVTTLDTFDRNEMINLIRSDIRWARSNALGQGARIVLQLHNNGSSYIIGVDELDYNDDGSSDYNVLTRNLPKNTSLLLTETIIFNSQGFSIDSNGDLQQVELTLNQGDNSFCTAILYPVGSLIFDC